jgi:hypothetical protein
VKLGVTKFDSQLTDKDKSTIDSVGINALLTLNDLGISHQVVIVRQIYETLDHIDIYVEKCIETIDATDSEMFILHDKPNISGCGYGWAWRNPEEFAYWFTEVSKRLRKERDVQIGYPGLKNCWDIYEAQMSHHVFMRESIAAVEDADFVNVSLSWKCNTDWREMYNKIYYLLYLEKVYGKPMICTYFNNNNNVSKEMKGEQYVEFNKELSLHSDRMFATFSHTLSSNDNNDLWVTWQTQNGKSAIPKIFSKWMSSEL